MMAKKPDKPGELASGREGSQEEPLSDDLRTLYAQYSDGRLPPAATELADKLAEEAAGKAAPRAPRRKKHLALD